MDTLGGPYRQVLFKLEDPEIPASNKPFEKTKYDNSANQFESQELLAPDTDSDADLKEDDSSTETVITLHDITMSLAKGELVGVCGSVGSGKTSIIQAILGMMVVEDGEIALNKDMNIAYVPQQAWIMNATVRDNILFGKEFDAEKYKKTVKACALLSDFEQLAAGDQTEIGERGINLSGGQKQRISLARAAYSDADLFLLDDPLSAVDAHVGQHLFTYCLKDLLKDKTVLFVTHQLQFLTDCDYILVMKDGQIAEEGTHNCLMGLSGGEYSNLIKTFHDSKEHTDDNEEQDLSTCEVDLESSKTSSKCFKKPEKVSLEIKPESIQDLQHKPGAGKLTTAEEVSHDTVKLSTLSGYLKAGGGVKAVLLVIGAIILYTGFQCFTNYWISHWIKAGSGGTYIEERVIFNDTQHTVLELSDRIVDNPNLHLYQAVYAGSLLLLLIAAYLNAHSYMAFCLTASTNLHDNVFKKTVACPMKFFDVTPSGQILNRFSKDTDEVDANLPFQSDLFFKGFTFVSSGLILMIYVTPYFLVASVPLFLVMFLIAKFSKPAFQISKRLENMTKSPLFSHIAASVQGLGTIKAYKKERTFFKSSMICKIETTWLSYCMTHL
ncbi:ABCC5 [Bugula neritina]|uniref:ABCC5 n=1 Tax=Bugula neritina TaxID=10212 RepID=A0A7J7J6C1_BUGNE|nr:ABCC5 [Bugula neritina]